jgi:cytochrome c oxidase cbb3-type subunit 4
MNFDINDLRSAVTVLSFFVFVGIVWWAYSGRQQKGYEEAAQLPLDDDSPFIHENSGHPSHPDN